MVKMVFVSPRHSPKRDVFARSETTGSNNDVIAQSAITEQFPTYNMTQIPNHAVDIGRGLAPAVFAHAIFIINDICHASGSPFSMLFTCGESRQAALHVFEANPI